MTSSTAATSKIIPSSIFNPANGTINLFTRDPRLGWVDTLSVGGGWICLFYGESAVEKPDVLSGDGQEG